MSQRLKTTGILAIAMLISSCASVDSPAPDDPYEKFNRTMYQVNDKLDKAIIKPIARGYDAIIPHKVQNHVTLFFKNISLLPSIANNLLQADLVQAMHNSGTFAANLSLGIGGLFDANESFKIGLKPQYADLGTTLTAFGATSAKFVMLPLLGPQTSNQAMALPFAMNTLSPVNYVDESSVRATSQSIELINFRSTMLPTDKLIAESFDPYVFVKDAYMQNRKAKVKHTSPSNHEEDSDDDLMDDLEFFDDLDLAQTTNTKTHQDLSRHYQRRHAYNLAYRMKNR